MLKKTLSTGLIVFMISGCVHWDAHLESQQKKYIGQPVEEMYAEYGAPTGIAPLKSGGNFVEFRSYAKGYLCEASVKTDKQGSVVSIVNVGGQNGCIAGRY